MSGSHKSKFSRWSRINLLPQISYLQSIYYRVDLLLKHKWWVLHINKKICSSYNNFKIISILKVRICVKNCTMTTTIFCPSTLFNTNQNFWAKSKIKTELCWNFSISMTTRNSFGSNTTSYGRCLIRIRWLTKHHCHPQVVSCWFTCCRNNFRTQGDPMVSKSNWLLRYWVKRSSKQKFNCSLHDRQ